MKNNQTELLVAFSRLVLARWPSIPVSRRAWCDYVERPLDRSLLKLLSKKQNLNSSKGKKWKMENAQKVVSFCVVLEWLGGEGEGMEGKKEKVR